MSRPPYLPATTHTAHRIGRLPDPWAFTPWKYGPFDGRWDDPNEQFRVSYAGATRFACLLEVLAPYRPNIELLARYNELDSDPRDDAYPTVPVGTVPADWLEHRGAATGTLTGRRLAIGHRDTLAWLRPRIAALAVRHEITDIDGACIRADHRAFTQAVSRWVYEWADEHGHVDGIEFDSRHGNQLTLWGLYERGDATYPSCLTDTRHTALSIDDPELIAALTHHQLTIDATEPPLPLEIVSGDAASEAFFPDGSATPATPLGAAHLWWIALLHRDTHVTALRRLSADPGDWGDYSGTAADFDGWSLMQNVEPCAEAPDDIAYVKFMPGTGHSMRAFGDAPLDDVRIVTVVRCPDGWWRVWGHSRNEWPSAGRVRYGIEN